MGGSWNCPSLDQKSLAVKEYLSSLDMSIRNNFKINDSLSFLISGENE